MVERKRRVTAVLVALLLFISGAIYESFQKPTTIEPAVQSAQTQVVEKRVVSGSALTALEGLEIKGRAPKTGYKRSLFGDGWELSGACNVRNQILIRDLTSVVTRSPEDCTVLQGTLRDPYTGKTIQFARGPETSDDVQIDHVVALSDAWQKGAQLLSSADRIRFANDGLNLLAVDGQTNSNKSDSDAASWLPPNKEFRCRYIARQIAVKSKYKIWVTTAENDAMKQVLKTCSDQQLPIVSG